LDASRRPDATVVASGYPTATVPGWEAAVTTRDTDAMHCYPDYTGCRLEWEYTPLPEPQIGT